VLSADAWLWRTHGAADDTALRLNGVSGNTYIGSTSVGGGTFRAMRASAFTVSSDRKWKADIEQVDADTRARMRTCKAVRFTDVDSGQTRIGFVANDLPPQVRHDIPPGDDDDPTAGAAYDLSALLALAWEEIHELRERIAALEQQ
jgi:hypothetical protein